MSHFDNQLIKDANKASRKTAQGEQRRWKRQQEKFDSANRQNPAPLPAKEGAK
jgi:hypothetical protein